MNPLTNMKNVLKLSEMDLKQSKTSWHDQYKNSAWIFVGGFPYELTEGDIICVFSQYGEIMNVNLVRDKVTGKQKGFCFLCYEDQRSTILAVDNLNGIKILGRTIRVDHVNDYKPPKDDKADEETKRLYMEGCGPKPQIPLEFIKREETVTPRVKQEDGLGLPERLPIRDNVKTESGKRKVKKEKKSKKSKSKKSKKHRRNSTSSSSSTASD